VCEKSVASIRSSSYSATETLTVAEVLEATVTIISDHLQYLRETNLLG